MDDLIRQKMIIRQSSLKIAVDILASGVGAVNVEDVKGIAKTIEEFVWELDKPKEKESKEFELRLN